LCGDLNLSNTVTSADVLAFKDFVLKGIEPAAEHGCMDLDGYEGVTLRDMLRHTHYVYIGVLQPNCGPGGPFLVPVSDTGYQLIYNNLIPPGDTMVSLHVDVRTAYYVQGVSLFLRVLVNGQTPQLSGDTAFNPNSIWSTVEFGDSSSAEVPPGYLMGGAIKFTGLGPPSGRYPLGRAELTLPPSSEYREVTLELVEWPPGDNAPMVVLNGNSNYDAVVALALRPWTVDLTGDANNDRALTAADVIWLVNYVFKAGKTPYPVPATGDVDCSASVTSSDIIKLVNHVFKSGTAPCDVEAECTINLDQWTCP